MTRFPAPRITHRQSCDCVTVIWVRRHTLRKIIPSGKLPTRLTSWIMLRVSNIKPLFSRLSNDDPSGANPTLFPSPFLLPRRGVALYFRGRKLRSLCQCAWCQAVQRSIKASACLCAFTQPCTTSKLFELWSSLQVFKRKSGVVIRFFGISVIKKNGIITRKKRSQKRDNRKIIQSRVYE